MQLDRIPYAILLGLGLVGCSDRSLGDGDGDTSEGTDTDTDATEWTGPCLSPPDTGPCLSTMPCLDTWTGPCLGQTGPCLQPPWTETWTDTDVTGTTNTGPCLSTGPCLDVTETRTDTYTSATTTEWTGPCLEPPTDTATNSGGLQDEPPADAAAVRSPDQIADADAVLERILRGDILPADVAERLQRERSRSG